MFSSKDKTYQRPLSEGDLFLNDCGQQANYLYIMTNMRTINNSGCQCGFLLKLYK